jgi:ferric-dicitrate binding protein FerR (iron transport regulator)
MTAAWDLCPVARNSLDMQKEAIAILINKHLSGELTTEESGILTAFVEDERNREQVTAILEELLASGDQQEEVFDAERYMPLLDRVLQVDKPSRSSVKRMLPLKRYWAAAAVILLLMSAAGYLLVRKDFREDIVIVTPDNIAPGTDKAMLTLSDGSVVPLSSGANQVIQQGATTVMQQGGQLLYNASGSNRVMSFNTLTTPRGGQFRIRLPDGTTVWLNAASSLRYPTAFEGKQRKVVVTGEAYFEVAANAEKPFIVTVDDRVEVSVLGTHFNVNAYLDEEGIQTTLLEGSVRVGKLTAGPQQSVLLKPGQQAQVRAPAAGITVVDNVNTEQAVAWKNGAFDFNGKKLEEVMRQLSRWYDIDVVYEGEIPDRQFWGKMGRDLDLSQCLNILEKMEVHFRMEKDRRLVVLP